MVNVAWGNLGISCELNHDYRAKIDTAIHSPFSDSVGLAGTGAADVWVVVGILRV